MGKQPYRVLQVVTIMNRGGIETMIMNHYRAIDRSLVQFDFLVHRKERGAYDDEIERLGGKIFRAFPIRPWNYLRYFQFLDRFFAQNHTYVAVHSHIQDNAGFALKYAKRHGISNLIANSHIAPLKTDYKFLFRAFGNHFTRKYATGKFACGTAAGQYMYGKNASFTVFHNAINVKDFIYNQAIRQKVRKALGLALDAFVIGNVARFSPQKNHKFLVQAFGELARINDKAHLLLVGDGPLMPHVKKQVASLGIEKQVHLLGVRNDVNELLQAFDVFFFPSLYEGLPVSVIEAQAAGLKCLLSDTIDHEVDVTGNVRFLPLSAPVEAWAAALDGMSNYDRLDMTAAMKKAGYDIEENVKWLTQYYLKDVAKQHS